MFSIKKNVLQTVALLKAYGIRQVVLSPGSRNAPLIQTFSQDAYFKCHTVVDERNAAFYALGIIQCLREPVVVCCTSGSALLNFAPAVSEAYYQQLPLVVISADRAKAWIGQMDGQTLPQAGAFGALVKKAVDLPEVASENDAWYCNRLVNEALMACTADGCGPVHINVPLSEPLFDYSQTQLPAVRRIRHVPDSGALSAAMLDELAQLWENSSKCMIVVGQSFPSAALNALLEQAAKKAGCVVLCEHLSNCHSPDFIVNFDALLQGTAVADTTLQVSDFAPDLLITLGGHIVSKRLKRFLRSHPPQYHWHISPSGEVADLFQSLTHLLKADACRFFQDILPKIQATRSPEPSHSFYDQWMQASHRIKEPAADVAFSDAWVVNTFLKALPAGAVLQVANSSVVRTIQLFPIDPSVPVYCNRGVNGIEGSLPCAVGFAAVHKGIVYLLIGDLSFFYSLSALWNIEHISNLRILLLNNGGGGIFHQLPGLNVSASLNDHVAAQHQTFGVQWGLAAGFQCLSAGNKKELNEQMPLFISDKIKRNMLFEVCTDTQTNLQVYQQYDHQLKVMIENDNR